MKVFMVIVFVCGLLVFPQLQTGAEAVDQNACVKKNNGQFRLVDDPEDCNPAEFHTVIEVNEDSDLEGEMCWLNSIGNCTLMLKFKSQGSSYSLIGNEICSGDTMMTTGNAYGSGYKENDRMQIGLTLTGLQSDSEMMITGIFHEAKVFVMDLLSGFGLVQHRESNDENECGDNPVPCIIQDSYTPVECP